MTRHSLLLAVLLNAALSCGVFAADAAGVSPAARGVATEPLSPEVKQALLEFSSEDFKVRQLAMRHLQDAFGRQLRALINSEEPEVKSRVLAVLEFNEGLTRWMINANRLPPAECRAHLDFGLRPDVLPVIVKIFSKEPEQRVAGIQAIARMKEPEATSLLAPLLDDSSRIVYIAAMEAVYDRAPTAAIIDSLWNRAVESGLNMYRRQVEPVEQPQVFFRGRQIGAAPYYAGAIPDASIATEVLLNYNSTLLAKKVEACLPAFEELFIKMPWISNIEHSRNFIELAANNPSPQIIKALYKMATSELRNRGVRRRGNASFWSNRTAPLAAVVQATGQKVEDYKLAKSTAVGGSTWCTASEEEEEEAVAKLKKWMDEKGEKFLNELAAASQPATAPATQPAPTR